MRFQTVDNVTDADAVIIAEALPALTGNGTDDLLCGGCNAVLAEKLVPEAIHRMVQTDRRLILRCTCGANNLVPDGAEADERDQTESGQ